MTLKTFTKYILPFLILLLAGGAYWALIASKPARQQPELAEKTWHVEVIEAQPRAMAPGLILYGRVESPERLRAAAPGNGIVARVDVRNGERVLAGAPLVQLDSQDFRTPLRQAEADITDLQGQIADLKIRYESDQAALVTERELLDRAAAEVDRLQQLQKRNLSAVTALDSARSALGRQHLAVISRQLGIDSFPARLQTLQARLERAEAQRDAAQLAMDRSSVSAPFDAIISQVEVSAGDRVSLGQTLLSLFPLNHLEIRAHLPTNHINAVQDALATGKVLLAQSVRESAPETYQLLRLAGEAEATGIDLYFAINHTAAAIRPGELLPIELMLPEQDNVIALPYQAIYGNSRIYKVVDERLHGVDVTTVGQLRGSNNASQVLIHSDAIASGDHIVITHLPNAMTGLKVSIHAL